MAAVEDTASHCGIRTVNIVSYNAASFTCSTKRNNESEMGKFHSRQAFNNTKFSHLDLDK